MGEEKARAIYIVLFLNMAFMKYFKKKIFLAIFLAFPKEENIL